MSQDPWEGTGWQPATLNYYTYVHGNPIKYVDPSGNCIVAWSGEVRMNDYPDGTSGICPHSDSPTTDYFWNEVAIPSPSVSSLLDRFNGNGLAAVIYYFRTYGSEPASTPLQSLLRETNGVGGVSLRPLNSQVQFGVEIPGGSLCEEFQDQQYYGNPWPAQTSYQMSHFLTATGLTYYNLNPGGVPMSTGLVALFRPGDLIAGVDQMKVALRLIIGHELVSDPEDWYQFDVWGVQYQATTDADIDDFIDALAADMSGDTVQRDRLLRRIVGLSPGEARTDRLGNSFEDLLLSLKGVEFGGLIRMGVINTSVDAAVWLETNLQR